MKFLKKSQIAIMSIAALVIMAGYVNYKYDPEREKKLGETVYVNSKEGYVYDENTSKEKKNENVNKEEIKENTEEKEKTTEEKNKRVEDDDPLAEFKLQRESMNSELIDSYNKIINSENTSKEKVEQYQEKLNDLISTKHLVTLVENIVKSNGIENIVIIPSNGNINAIIATAETLDKSKVAIVEGIIKNEFKVESSKISISVKNMK